MQYRYVLEPVSSHTYDIVVIPLSKPVDFDVEFSLEWFSKPLQIRMVTLMLAGTVAFSIPFSYLASADGKYSMTYLSYGSYDKQLEYVALSNNSFSVISPSYFNIGTDGSLAVEEISASYVDAMHQKNVKIVPFLSNHWDRTAGNLAMKNVDKLAEQVAQAVEKYNLDGVNVDIENVTHQYREQYTELVRLLRRKIPKEKEVSVAVAANPNGWNLGWHGSYDYKALGEIADHLFLMAYDEHYNGGEAGPVASISFVERSIQYALQYVPKEKIVLGVPFFGRIWSDDGRMMGVGITNRQIASALEKTGGNSRIDSATKSVKARFTVGTNHSITVNGQKLKPGSYTVWYDNSDTLKYKLSLVDKYGLKGAGSWSVGQETQDVWDYYSLWLNGKYFSDTFDHFAKDDILIAYDKGWMEGTSSETFSPSDGMTRAQAAVILCRYLGLQDNGATVDFPDISNHWAEQEIRIAVSHGLMNGYPDGSFLPNKAVTREEIAVILQRALQYEYQVQTALGGFSDLSPDRWSYREIIALIQSGIFSGYPDNTFRPEQYLSRGEMAHLIKKTLQEEH